MCSDNVVILDVYVMWWVQIVWRIELVWYGVKNKPVNAVVSVDASAEFVWCAEVVWSFRHMYASKRYEWAVRVRVCVCMCVLTDWLADWSSHSPTNSLTRSETHIWTHFHLYTFFPFVVCVCVGEVIKGKMRTLYLPFNIVLRRWSRSETFDIYSILNPTISSLRHQHLDLQLLATVNFTLSPSLSLSLALSPLNH